MKPLSAGRMVNQPVIHTKQSREVTVRRPTMARFFWPFGDAKKNSKSRDACTDSTASHCFMEWSELMKCGVMTASLPRIRVNDPIELSRENRICITEMHECISDVLSWNGKHSENFYLA